MAVWALTWLIKGDHQQLPRRPAGEPGPLKRHLVRRFAERHPRKWVQLTLKQLILTVAILCVMLAGVKVCRERVFSRLAAYHAQEEARWNEYSPGWASAQARPDYHGRMRRIYERATFVTIIPDEPEPLLAAPPVRSRSPRPRREKK